MDTIKIETVKDDVTHHHIISDQVDMETAIIQNNQRHFSQLEGTPPILGNGHNNSCTKILQGIYTPPKGIPTPMKCHLEEMERQKNTLPPQHSSFRHTSLMVQK